MACQYDNYELNKIYEWTDVHIYCYNCGHENPKNNLTVKYKYKNKGEHIFKIINEFRCLGCESEICSITAPCGGSYYLNESDVSKSLLLLQEFINHK